MERGAAVRYDIGRRPPVVSERQVGKYAAASYYGGVRGLNERGSTATPGRETDIVPRRAQNRWPRPLGAHRPTGVTGCATTRGHPSTGVSRCATEWTRASNQLRRSATGRCLRPAGARYRATKPMAGATGRTSLATRRGNSTTYLTEGPRTTSVRPTQRGAHERQARQPATGSSSMPTAQHGRTTVCRQPATTCVPRSMG